MLKDVKFVLLFSILMMVSLSFFGYASVTIILVSAFCAAIAELTFKNAPQNISPPRKMWMSIARSSMLSALIVASVITFLVYMWTIAMAVSGAPDLAPDVNLARVFGFCVIAIFSSSSIILFIFRRNEQALIERLIRGGILKKSLGSVFGVALAGTFVYVAVGPVLRWYIDGYVADGAETTSVYVWAKAISALAILIGATMGWRLATRLWYPKPNGH